MLQDISIGSKLLYVKIRKTDRKPVVLKLAVYVTDERINFSDIDRVEDNIFNLIRKGYAYIKEHINWSVVAGEGTSRVEVPEIPVEAIREIVVNSFAHANYRGISENEIDITPTRVEIYNPGAFPPGLSPEIFARQRIQSMPRNKVILSTLYGKIERKIEIISKKSVYQISLMNNRRLYANGMPVWIGLNHESGLNGLLLFSGKGVSKW